MGKRLLWAILKALLAVAVFLGGSAIVHYLFTIVTDMTIMDIGRINADMSFQGLLFPFLAFVIPGLIFGLIARIVAAKRNTLGFNGETLAFSILGVMAAQYAIFALVWQDVVGRLFDVLLYTNGILAFIANPAAYDLRWTETIQPDPVLWSTLTALISSAMFVLGLFVGDRIMSMILWKEDTA